MDTSFTFLKDGGSGPDRLQVGRDFKALSNDHCGQLTGVDMYEGYVCVVGNHQGQGVCSVSTKKAPILETKL